MDCSDPISASCHCGQLRLSLRLPTEATACSPRHCDCDYCVMHGAAWVSDPAGALHILTPDPAMLGRYRQGARLAEFLFCTRCGVLVAAIHEVDGRRLGVANARLFAATLAFGPATAVSPKSLAPHDKAQRWQRLWFQHVTIRSGDPRR